MATKINETLELLEWRLERLEHFLARDDSSQQATQEQDVEREASSIVTRVKTLEARLTHLISRNASAMELIDLHTTLPEVFNTNSSDRQDSGIVGTDKLPIVLSSSDEYSLMASDLTSLREYSIPNAGELPTLLTMESRLASFEAMQDFQMEEIQRLRHSSATLVQEWYETHVLSGGSRWADYEDRLVHAELAVRRKEAARAREQNEG